MGVCHPEQMAFSAGAAWAHLDALGEEHHITVKACKIRAHQSEASIASRVVWVPSKLTPLRYLAALHELGHIVSDTSRRAHYEFAHGGRAPAVLDSAMACEAAAWGWAYEHRDRRLVPTVQGELLRKLLGMLGTHLVGGDD